MENPEITMNGMALSLMGATLLTGAYSELLTPPELKDFVENNDPLKNGTEVIVPGTDGEEDTSTPKLKERSVTLTFLIQGENREDFFAKYAAFVAQLHKGAVRLQVPELNRYFDLIYSNSTQFANYLLHACKLAVKFREPIPTVHYINPPDGPEPDDPNTTTDEMGIRWYNTHIIIDSNVDAAKISAPLSIFPELASYSKKIDGRTINYYNRNAIANILNQVANANGLDSIQYVYDPIFFGVFSGLCQIQPMDFRTVWAPIVTENGLIRGDVIVQYPKMGYYKDGIWHQGDIYFMYENQIYINELKEKDGEVEEILIEGDDVAAPLKLMVLLNNPDSASTAGLSKMSSVSPVSLFGSRR